MKYIIVGLGNPSEAYAFTRHNIGFEILDSIGLSFESKRYAWRAKMKYRGRTLLFFKPTTYMNRSGEAVRYWLAKEKVGIEHLLVVSDDISLPFGVLRMREKGSDGGHNGLKSIEACIGSRFYARLRFGIGREGGKDASDYVLSVFDAAQRSALPPLIARAKEMIQSYCIIGVSATMNAYSSR